jgi:hypothetical protein
MIARFRFFPLLLQYACLVVLAIALPALVWGGAGTKPVAAERFEVADKAASPAPAISRSQAPPVPLRAEPVPVPAVEKRDTALRPPAIRRTAV